MYEMYERCTLTGLDHLTRVLFFCGTPDTELLAKITCEEVNETTQ